MLRTKGFRKIGVFFAAFFPMCYIEGKQITDGSKQRNGQPTVGTAVWNCKTWEGKERFRKKLFGIWRFQKNRSLE